MLIVDQVMKIFLEDKNKLRQFSTRALFIFESDRHPHYRLGLITKIGLGADCPVERGRH